MHPKGPPHQMMLPANAVDEEFTKMSNQAALVFPPPITDFAKNAASPSDRVYLEQSCSRVRVLRVFVCVCADLSHSTMSIRGTLLNRSRCSMAC